MQRALKDHDVTINYRSSIKAPHINDQALSHELQIACAQRKVWLSRAGFKMNPHHEGWTKNFANLLLFKQMCGHLEVSDSAVLSRFIDNMRALKRKGLLASSRVDRLDGLG
jgi:hypothetical protein